MKTRLGFVSNSSSSSFVCDLTGRVESGYDMPLTDAGMFECINGHTVSDDLKLSPKFIIEEAITNFVDFYNKPTWRKTHVTDAEVAQKCSEAEVDDWESFFEVVQENWDDEYGGKYGTEMPKEFCPICMMQQLPKDQVLTYLLEKIGRSQEDVTKEIRESFVQYDKFKEHLNGSK